MEGWRKTVRASRTISPNVLKVVERKRYYHTDDLAGDAEVLRLVSRLGAGDKTIRGRTLAKRFGAESSTRFGFGGEAKQSGEPFGAGYLPLHIEGRGDEPRPDYEDFAD